MKRSMKKRLKGLWGSHHFHCHQRYRSPPWHLHCHRHRSLILFLTTAPPGSDDRLRTLEDIMLNLSDEARNYLLRRWIGFWVYRECVCRWDVLKVWNVHGGTKCSHLQAAGGRLSGKEK